MQINFKCLDILNKEVGRCLIVTVEIGSLKRKNPDTVLI